MPIDTEKCCNLLELIERLETLKVRGHIEIERADAGIEKAKAELDGEFVE